MRRFWIIFLLVAIPFGSNGIADERTNIEIANLMVEAINERDLDRLDSLIATDMARHSAATPGVTVTNLEEFKNFLRTDFISVPDSEISIDLIFGNDEFVGLRAVYSGTQTGDMGPFPASGNRVELPFLSILRFENQSIAEMWVEWDNVHMLSQLGHLLPVNNASD